MIRNIKPQDFEAIYALVKATGTLDVHHPYSYWVMFNHSPDFCQVYEHEEQVAGFVTGMKGFREEGNLFLWQIGVHPGLHQRGIGSQLAEHFFRNAFAAGFSDIYFTIAPDNQASIRLFEKTANALGKDIEVTGSTGSQGGLITDELIFRVY